MREALHEAPKGKGKFWKLFNKYGIFPISTSKIRNLPPYMRNMDNKHPIFYVDL